MKRILLWGLLGLVLVVAAGLVAAYLFLGRIVKTAIETAGPMVTQCPVTVAGVDLRPLRGSFRIRGLSVGNPEGFHTPEALRVDEIRVAMEPGTVFSNLVHIREISVSGPQVTYEIGLGKTNIGTIQGNVQAFLERFAGESKDKDKEPEPKGSSRKVVIDQVRVENGQINLSGTILQGRAVPVPLPTLTLNNVGGGAVSGPQAAAEILDRILHGVLDAAKEGVSQLGDSVKDAGEAIKREAGSALQGVRGLFQKKR